MTTTTGSLAPGGFQRPKSSGRIAYEAYFEARAKSWPLCDPLPEWIDQRQQVRDAWEASASAVLERAAGVADAIEDSMAEAIAERIRDLKSKS